MKVEIKTPFAVLEVEMYENGARKLVSDALEYSDQYMMNKARTRLAVGEAAQESEKSVPKMKAPKRESSEIKKADAAETELGYRGFLHITCAGCGDAENEDGVPCAV